MWNRFADMWCNTMHRDAMWPIHGRYICSRCLREHTVEWEKPAAVSEYRHLVVQSETPVVMESHVWAAQR